MGDGLQFLGFFRDPYDLDPVRDVLAQRRLVDGAVKAFVMGPQCVQDLPDDAVALIVLERDLGLHPRGHADRKDDVTHLLALGTTHDAPDGLDHVDQGFAWVKEHDCVEGRHVDAFGQAAGIGEDARGIALGIGFEPVQKLVAGLGVEGAIDMLDLDVEAVRR